MKKIIGERFKNIYPRVSFKKTLDITKPNIIFSTINSLNQSDLVVNSYFKENIPESVKTDVKKLGVGKFTTQNKSVLVVASVPDEKETEENIFLLRENTSKALANAKNILDKSKEVNIQFSEYIDDAARNKIVNNLILSSYDFNLSSKVSDKSEKNKEKDEKKKKKELKLKDNQDEKIEKIMDSRLAFNFYLDQQNEKNIEELKFQIRLAMSSLEARELCNLRADIATTDFILDYITDLVNKIESNKVKLHVLDGDKLEKEGYNLIYSVGKASVHKPKIVAIEYKGIPESKITHSIIGKGLTFDTGGLNLKPGQSMDTMFYDKHGACTTISLLHSISKLDLKINCVFVVGLAENSVDSKSYRPSDIILSKSGNTVEVGNTDAEGRLVLADCFTYVQNNFSPKIMIDIATLTGACKVALGSKTAGLFSNDDQLAKDLILSSKATYEDIWRLPITDSFKEQTKGTYSDLKSIGKGGFGGASFAAAFLEKFVNKGIKWAHLDIAGPGFSDTKSNVFSAGATGFGTQLLTHYLIKQTKI